MSEPDGCPTVTELERSLEESGERATRISTHLAGCPRCRALREELRDNLEYLRGHRDRWLDAHRPIPLRIEGYEIGAELHRGGQGVVYEAQQVSTRRPVAVKVLLAGREATRSQRRRFEREIEVAAGLSHPHIVTVFDSGRTEDGREFFVMERIEGRELDRYLREESPSMDRRLQLFEQIASAVHHAHQRAVLHRDLKPANILIDARGDPRILDFGLAKEIGGEARPEATRSGEFLGTLAFASPEQLRRSEGEVSVASDVYSLGVILFRMLTGEHPYDVHRPLSEVVETIVSRTPPPPSSRAPRIDSELDAVVAKTLRKEPQERYRSAGELVDDLRRHRSGHPVLARGHGPGALLWATIRRHRWAAAGLLSLLLGLGAAAVISTLALQRSEEDRRQLVAETGKLREVRDFLRGILASADPYVGGRDVTVVSLLADAERRLEELEVPEVRAELESTLGETYAGLGLHEDALRWRELAWEHWRRLEGEGGQSRLQARLALAHSLLDLSRGVDASPHVDELLAQCEANRDLELRFRLSVEAAVADRDRLLGQRDACERRLGEVLGRARDALGPEDVDVASLALELAIFLIDARRLDEAEPRVREALEAFRQALGEDHPSTLGASNTLGSLLIERRDLDRAEELLRRTLDRRLQRLGEDHPAVFRTLANLGLCLLYQDRPEEARGPLERARSLGVDNLPAGHPDLLKLRRSLAGLSWKQGALPAALVELEEAHAIASRRHGSSHPISLEIGSDLALLRRADGRPEEALDLLWDCYDAASSGAEPPSPAFLDRVRLSLGMCALDVGALEEAREVLEELEGELWQEDRAGLMPGVHYTLFQVYEAQGDDAAADELRRRPPPTDPEETSPTQEDPEGKGPLE